MKLSRAVAVAADGMDLPVERLRAIASTLAASRRRADTPEQPDNLGGIADRAHSAPAPDAAIGHRTADPRAASHEAMAASRRLLTRTIAMLR